MMPVQSDAQVKLTVAYDGGEFYGFQRQREEPTVQSTLEATLHSMARKPVPVHGAGRTDSGVHAWGQVVCFRPPVAMSIARWPRALNRLLPPSLVVRSAELVPGDFDPVRWAKWKHYRYRISVTDVLSPFQQEYVHHLWFDPDIGAMRRAALQLLGRRDFASFQVSGRPVSSTVRCMYQLSVTARGELITVDMVADGFLYRMARSIVGTLLEVARGSTEPGSMENILAGRDRSLAGPTAPARGLYLMRVCY